jgi:hypothetical protein
MNYDSFGGNSIFLEYYSFSWNDYEMLD